MDKIEGPTGVSYEQAEQRGARKAWRTPNVVTSEVASDTRINPKAYTNIEYTTTYSNYHAS